MKRRDPLRVLMTGDTAGGVWTYALELARALGVRGVDVWLATMGERPTPAQRRAAAEIANLELVASDFALEWMDGAGDDVDAAGEWLLDLERALGVDLVHVNGYAHAALPFRSPVVAVAHSCVCSWWRAVLGEEAPPRWDDYRRRVSAGLSAAGAVIAPTAAILEAILDCYDSRASGRVIVNGLDPGSYRAVRKEPFVLSAGRLWDAAKGLDALDACAARVPWPVVVAGPTDHPDGGAVRSRSARLSGARARPPGPALPGRDARRGSARLSGARARPPGPALPGRDARRGSARLSGARARPPGPALPGRDARRGSARLLGRLPPGVVHALMSRAAIYALPARYEPFGLSALEAGLSGCALVLGDIPTLRELWDGAALFVPPGDPEALGAALTALAGNPIQRRSLAARARRRASRYTSARMGSAYRELYGELVGAAGEKGGGT